MTEPDESRLWKYMEIPQEFQRRAGEIDLTSKQHLRIVEKLAKYLAKQKAKTKEDFERVEYLKDFVIKSAQLNEQTLDLVAYLRDRLNEIYKDYKAFSEGARLNRVIRDQGERLELITHERDEAQKELHELRKRIRRENTATAQ